MSRILILGGALAALLVPAAIAHASTGPSSQSPILSKQVETDGQLARRGRGADDGPGHTRQCRGCDDGPNHTFIKLNDGMEIARRGRGADDAPGDDRRGRGRGADDAPGDDRRGRGRGTDDGPNHT